MWPIGEIGYVYNYEEREQTESMKIYGKKICSETIYGKTGAVIGGRRCWRPLKFVLKSWLKSVF